MRKIEITLYTIEELKELDEEAYKNAIEAVKQERYQDFYDWETREILDTLKKVAEFFHMKITDYQIQLWGTSWVDVDVSNFYDLDNDKKQELSDWLNENLQEGMDGSCPFTGVFYDCYFFDEVYELTSGLGVDITDLHEFVPEALRGMVGRIVNEYENDISDNESNEQYAMDNLEFYENGLLFKK